MHTFLNILIKTSYENIYHLRSSRMDYISGAPIYQRNKAMYMKEQGWNVYYISTCHGKVYVKGLEQFIVATCTFLCKEAYVYPRNKQKDLFSI